MSRPTEYTEDLALRICERTSEGDSLKQICQGEEMPSRRTVYSWLASRAEFEVMHNAARKEHAHAEFERMHAIADEPPDRDDKQNISMGWVQNQRVRLDTRKWTLARMDPKKYGDETRIVGAGGDPLVLNPLSEMEMARRIAFALTKAGQSDPAAIPLQLTHEQPVLDLYGKPIVRPWN